MSINVEKRAADLVLEIKEGKRIQHQQRRRIKRASTELEELKKQCKLYGIKLVVDSIDQKGS